MRKTYPVLAAALLLFAAPAFAHPGHDFGGNGLFAGLLHPFTGLDHLLAMLVVGVWAAQLGGAARFAVPASFVALMAVGAGLAVAGWTPPHIEAGIAASLLVLGLASALALRLPLLPAMLLAGGFAVFHGAAHGSELPLMAQPSMFVSGFLLATVALHVSGLLLGSALAARRPLLVRASGVLTAAAGLAYVVAG